MAQLTDILMELTPDGGDFVIENNDLKGCYSYENLVIMYLFGGNVKQDTTAENTENAQNFDWWGNRIGNTEVYNSSFERTLKTVVLNTVGVRALINAAKEDLKPIEEYATVTVTGSIPMPNRFQMIININGSDQFFIFENNQLISVRHG